MAFLKDSSDSKDMNLESKTWKVYQEKLMLQSRVLLLQFVTLVKFCKNVIHHCPNNNSEESSPCRVDKYHIPAPSIHHAHRSEFIGHIRTESEKSRFFYDLEKCPLSLNSWDHHEEKNDEDVEEVKCDRRDIIHISIEICRYVFPKCRKDHEIDHDAIEEEKCHDSRDVGEKGSEHRTKWLIVNCKLLIILYPVFIFLIRFDGRESDNTRSIVFMRRFDHRLHIFPILWSSLVDRDDLIIFRESPFPPVHALDRKEVRTSDEMSIQEISSDPDRFRFRWMSDIDEKEGHRVCI